MKTTKYFRTSVMKRRPYLKQEWIKYVLDHPLHIEEQDNGRWRYWAMIFERGKYLRVVIESDGETVHNAFFDLHFKL